MASPPPSVAPFFGLERAAHTLERSRYVVLPLPWERTVSYGRGTAAGPGAALRASQYVELYDEELRDEPSRHGVCTLAEPELSADLARGLQEIASAARPHYRSGKRLVAIGGEHSLTPPLVAAAREVWPTLGVVQFDAHADLRAEYEGSAHSHACAMHRVLDLGVPTLQVGIRALSSEEADLIEDRRLDVVWADPTLRAGAAQETAFAQAVERLPEHVYLTFDVDYFDPSLLPATGPPEPGGGTWYPTLEMLRRLFSRRRVVAADVVELAPIAGQPASDFLVARLLHKLIGYWQHGS